MSYERGALRPPGAMAKPPDRERRCPDDDGRLERTRAGRFFCKVCGRTWDEANLRSERS